MISSITSTPVMPYPPKDPFEDSRIPTLKSLAAWHIIQQNELRDISRNLKGKIPDPLREYVEIFQRYVSPEILVKFESDPEFLLGDDKDIDDEMFLELIKTAFSKGKFLGELALFKLLFISTKKGFILSMKLILEESCFRHFDIINITISDKTPLMMAAQKGHTEAIKELVNAGATVSRQALGTRHYLFVLATTKLNISMYSSKTPQIAILAIVGLGIAFLYQATSYWNSSKGEEV